MERSFNKQPILTASQAVSVRVLGLDRDPIHGTVQQISGEELQVILRISPAPRYLILDAPVRIDAPETMLLGELIASRLQEGATILTIAVRHVLTHLSELTRMRRALLDEAAGGCPGSEACRLTPLPDTILDFN